MCVFAGEGLRQVHQQDLPPADLPPDPPLQVEQAERAQEEVPGLVSVPPPQLCRLAGMEVTARTADGGVCARGSACSFHSLTVRGGKTD